MKISIAADHGGYLLKNTIKLYLESKNYSVKDHGTDSSKSVDYPDYASLVTADILSQNADFGILFCSSGVGMSIAANKIKSIRAVLVYNEDTACFARLHNNANIICLGQKYITPYLAQKYINIFISTQFEAGRHLNRIEKLEV